MSLPPPPAIRKIPLHDQVVESLRDLIIEGHLEPGTRIEEVSLASYLGVSRTPLREAMRTLAAEGLIDMKAARGATVRKLQADEVRSMLEVLAELERLAGRLAIERASNEALKELTSIHDEMAAHFSRRERMPYYKLNQEFHSRVCGLSDNVTLIDVHARLQAQLKRIRFIGNRDEEKWCAAMADHERMVDAIRARDGEALGAALADHLAATWERVAEAV